MAASMLSFSSCDNDSREDELFAGLDGLEKRIEVLETLQDQITAIQQLLEAADRNHITSIEEVTDAGRTGFKINFKDSAPITIYNGINGTNGVNAPTISVKKYDDGKFYWTLNGEFIEIEGAKILAEGSKGDNGVTPKLKIENNTWKVSYDGGNKWSTVEGAATGGAGTGSNVSYEEAADGTYYIFTINGSTINVPKYVPLAVTFTYEGKEGTSFEGATANGGDEYVISYVIGGLATGQVPVVEAIGKNGYEAVVDAAAEKVRIKAPDIWSAGSVLIFISDGDQRTIMRSVNFYNSSADAGTQIVVEDGGDVKEVEYDAEKVDLSYQTDIQDENLVVTIAYIGKTEGWLIRNTALTKALVDKTLSFTLTNNNTTREERVATVTISDKINTSLTKTFTIKQKGDPDAPEIIEVSSGNLATLLGGKVETATSLMLSGTLGNEDWGILKTMAKSKNLANLDLSLISNKEVPKSSLLSSKLVTVKLPNSVELIGNNAFSGCWLLTTVNLPDGLKKIDDYAFDKCSKLTWSELIIPASVTEIGIVAFRNCNMANKKLIVKGNTKLGTRAFASNVLWGSDNVTGIKFSEVVLEGDEKLEMGDYVFGNSGDKISVLRVSSSLLDEYQQDEYLKTRFEQIVGIE